MSANVNWCQLTYGSSRVFRLRYYASFKVRKFESLFYKIKIFLPKNYHLHWIAGKAYILYKYIMHIFFSILGVAFAVPFLCHFQKLQLLVVKKFLNKICYIVLLFVWAQKICLRILKSYLKLAMLIILIIMLIILPFVESFLVDIFNQKLLFSE